MLGDSIRRRRGDRLGWLNKRRTGGPEAPRPPLAARTVLNWMLAGLAAILLSFGTGYALAVQVLFPAPDYRSGAEVPVPRLIGRELGDAEREIEAAGLQLGEVTRLPHPSKRAGEVLAQTPLPEQQLPPGGEVRLAISAGPARATVPDVVGLPADDAAGLAHRMGFEVNRRTEVAPSAVGRVIRVVPAPGTEQVLPASVTLFVGTEPESWLPPVPEDEAGGEDAGADS